MRSDTSFKGIPVAKAKTPFNTFQIYKITTNDNDFIKKVQHNINLKKLMPGLKNETYDIWEAVTDSALSTGLHNSSTVVLATENRPCGAMNFSQNKTSFDLNYISTWPIKKGEKVPFAGKTLFMELCRRFLEEKLSSINLIALRYAPFDPVGKYLRLGFKPYGGNDYAEIMRINKERVKNTFETLKENISFEPIKDAKNIDLLQELNINA